jgi:5-methylcytosine-specific restriction endonuclease McrA
LITKNKENKMARQQIRPPKPEWVENKKQGLCPICKKPKKKFEPRRRVYCSEKCADVFNNYVTSWNVYVWRKLKKHNFTCNKCGITLEEIKEQDPMASYGYLEVDHIVPIALGGDMWEDSNLQVLCRSCHKEKTKQDMKKIVEQRKGYNDITFFKTQKGERK